MTARHRPLRIENGKIRVIDFDGAHEDMRHGVLYRESNKPADEAIASAPNESFDVVCGMRMGFVNSSWPGAWCRLDDEGVAFDCSGFEVQARWAEVKSVDVVKRFHLIGSGVRFRIPALRPETVLVWLGNRKLVELLIELCRVHEIPVVQKPGEVT
jgi:hypothetical protein